MGRVYHIDLLCILFGIGTWVCVNGLWVELPLLVRALPEGWNLPSFMSVVTQLANVGPLAYSILHSVWPRRVTEKGTIYLTMTMGCIATVLLVFFWDKTTYFLGDTRSTALLALVFCLAFVDCSSRVLFLPFMARFQAIYLTSFFIGEGLSGFVPSIFALIQGVGGNPECRWENQTDPETGEEVPSLVAFTPDPLFTVETFFVFLTVTMIVSGLAFHLLTLESVTQKALARPTEEEPSPHEGLIAPSTNNPIRFYQSTSPTNSRHKMNTEEETSFEESQSPVLHETSRNGGGQIEKELEGVNVKEEGPEPLFSHVAKPLFLSLLVVQAVVCCLGNGVFPSIQSYSCLPYGNVAYHWAVTLSTMSNPAVCFMLFILPRPTPTSIAATCVAAFGVASYCMATAVMSPTPPLLGTVGGEAILVFSWILQVGLFTYIKVSIATLLRDEGKRGLFWCGAVTQAGSAIGAIVTFFIVNDTTIFQSYYPCQESQAGTTPIPALSTLN